MDGDPEARGYAQSQVTSPEQGMKDISASRPVERLDVEDEDARAQRLQSIFEKLNAGSSSSGGASTTATGIPNFNFDFGERKTWAVEPPSELLARVQGFLPQMEASNMALAQQAQADPQSVDIEHVEDGVERYIEMNLGLGVFDTKPTSASSSHSQDEDTEMSNSESSSASFSSSSSSSASSSSLSGSSNSSSSTGSDSDSDADSDSDSDLDSEEILSSFIPSSLLSRSYSDSIPSSGKAPRLIRPLPKRSASAQQPVLVASVPPRPSIVVLSESRVDDHGTDTMDSD